jgi:hypothetical protein
MIIYITHSNNDLTEEINDFAKKKSKRVAQEKIYTQKPYIFVGRNFEVPRSVITGEVSVKGHWRWQPHGPQRAFIKHIYIEPHVRNKQPK